MCEIRAEYVGELNRKDGVSCWRCALCGEVVCELDLERYEPESGEGLVECCNTCRETFEFDSEAKIEADVIDSDLFAQFVRWTVDHRKPPAGECLK